MKKIALFSSMLLFFISANGQVGPGDRKRVQGVTIYEHANFTGQNKVLGIGSHRLFGQPDLNDMISSIKVAPGFAVIVYEHANESGGFGGYVDLLEDSPDLSVYHINDRVSYLSVFSIARRGFVYARNRMVNKQFVAGHWERIKANGRPLPDNSLPATSSVLPATLDPDDIANAPMASQSEIDEFNHINKFQLSVGVLGGETTKPFYFHHNEPDEEIYKYNKVIDPARLPGAFFDSLESWAQDKLGRAAILVKPLVVATELATDIKDWLFGSSSTKMKLDCWFPVSEYKKTFCGRITKDSKICGQDYVHTQVTVDKDVCYHIEPSEPFKHMLVNPWISDNFTDLEGEVKASHLRELNPQTQKSVETLDPRNPMLLQIKKDENVCMFGPWMGDILDLNLKVPIPFTESKLKVYDYVKRTNNEIHPINQLWRKLGAETQLIAIADETGYFQKVGNNEIEASGLNQRMRFYVAFFLPANKTVSGSYTREYDINGFAYDISGKPATEVPPYTVTLKHDGKVRVKINDNASVRSQRTHQVFFEKVRRRTDGSVHGYMVVETVPITKPGGSINIFVKDITVYNNQVDPVRPIPTRQ